MKNLLLLFILIFSRIAIFAQAPANDECANAVAVPINTTLAKTNFVTGTVTGATLSTNIPVGISPVKDVWYKFTATAPFHVVEFFDYNPNTTPLQEASIHVIKGNCNNLADVITYFTSNDAFAKVIETEVGSEYRIRISGIEIDNKPSPLSTFKLCLTTINLPSTNITCSNSVLLNIPTVGSYLNLKGNNNNAIPTKSNTICYNDGNDEKTVWYSFTAQQNAYNFKLENVICLNIFGNALYFIKVFEGDDCDNKTPIYCSGKLTSGLNNSFLTKLDHFIVGKKYYLAISSYYETPVAYDLKIQATQNAPSNDICGNAKNLTVNKKNSCTSQEDGATGNCSFGYYQHCIAANNHQGDIWYSFIAKQKKQNFKFSNVQPTNNLVYEVFEGDCTEIISFNCKKYDKDTLIDGFNIGKKYYICVRNIVNKDSFPNHTFTLCVQEGPKPVPNDDIEDATVLDVNPDLVLAKYKNGTLKEATFSGLNTQCGLLNSGDAFYTFTAINKRHILHFTHTSNTVATVMYSLLNIVECANTNDSLFFLENLIIGKKYIVKVESFDEPEFKIGIITPPAAPANDLCLSASNVTPSNDWSCKNSVSGSTYYASTTPLLQESKYDVWYSFTATAEKHVVYLENIVGIESNNIQIELAVKSGNCSQDSTIYANETPNSPTKVIGNLTIGQKYFIQVSALNSRSFFFFDLCVLTPTAQIPNSLCSKAKNLPISPTEVIAFAEDGITSYKLYSHENTPIKESESVWYKFQATSTKHQVYFYDIKNTISSSTTPIRLKIYDGDCDSTKLLHLLLPEEDEIFNTIVGKTYFIQVFNEWTEDRAKFKLSVVTVPTMPNDDCSGAKSLQISGDTKPIFAQIADFHWATDSSKNYVEPDLWYTFVAEKKVHTVQTTSLDGGVRPRVEIYVGNCGNFTLHKLIPFVSDTFQLIRGLVVGQKYYMKLTYQTNLGLCICKNIIAIGTPPIVVPNDDIEDATIITPGAANTCQVNNLNLTWASSKPDEDLCTNQINNVWYKFVAQKDKYIIDIDTLIEDIGFSFHYKNANDSLVVHNNECYRFLPFGEVSTKKWITNLTIGRTYWIRVFADTKKDLRFCLSESPTNPANDHYNNAITLPTNTGYNNCTQKISSSIKYASPSLQGIYVPCDEDIADLWYKFKAEKEATYTAKIIYPSTEKDTLLRVNFYRYDSVAQVMAHYTCAELKQNELSAMKDSTYYVRVSQRSAIDKKIDFDICLNYKVPPTPPANDECAGAIPLTVQNYGNCSTTTYQYKYVTTSIDTIACFSIPLDVWFSFVATDTLLHLQVKNITDINNSFFSLELFKGDGCSNKKLIGCYSYPEYSKMSGLEIGKKYYIRLLNNFSNHLDFQICLQKLNLAPPNNDICSGAINIPVNTTKGITTFLNGDNHFSNLENTALTDNLCDGNAGIINDVWYKFTATKKGHFIRLYDKKRLLSPVGSGALVTNIQVYRGNCNAGFTQYGCNPLTSGNVETYDFDNLTVGETYYIRLISYDLSDYFSYKIAVLEKTMDNSCSNPVNIQYNQIYEGHTATPAVNAPWLSNTSSPKVNLYWYRFKAEEAQAIIRIANSENYGVNEDYMGFVILKNPCTALNQDFVGKYDLPAGGTQSSFIPNLKKDSTYYLVFVTAQTTISSVRFVLEKTNVVAVNDNCAGALDLPVIPNLTINTFLKDSIDTRFSAFLKYKYYKFKATAKNHILYHKILNNKQYTYPIYLKFSCDSVQQYLYDNKDTVTYLPNLTIGKDYWIQIQADQDFAIQDKSRYNLAILTPSTPPANDDCSGAISIDAVTTAATNCTNSVSIKLKNATPDTLFASQGYTDMNHQWYSFTAKAINHLLKINNVVVKKPAFSIGFNIQLIETSNCAQYKILKSINYNPIDSTESNVIFNNLTVGKKYYFAIGMGDWRTETDFNLCLHALPQSPANDLCENAINLTPIANVTSGNVTKGTLKNAYVEKQSNNYYSARDVWYSFTATSKFHQLYVDKGQFYYLLGEIRDKDCETVGVDWEISSKYTSFNDLVIGKKYYIGIKYSQLDTTRSLDFKIAIVAPNVVSQNNACDKAIILPVSSTPNVQQYSNGDLRYNQTLWYKFVATSKSHRIKMVSQSPNLKVGSIFSSPVTGDLERRNNCNPVDTSVAGFTAANRYLPFLLDTTSYTNVVSGLTVGATYYIRIYNQTGTLDTLALPFKIGISTVSAPNNIACYLAKKAPINPDKNLTNFLSENSDGLYFQDQFGLATGLLYYEFTATSKRHQVVFQDLNTDLDYYASMLYEVYEGNCQSSSFIKSSYVPNFKEEDEVLNNLIVGKKYYIFCHLEKRKIVYDGGSIPNVNMTFKVGVITHPPSPTNDNCKDAKTAVVNNNPQCQQVTKGTTLNATKDADAPCFQEGADDNVWFKFTATSDLHFIQLKNIKPIIGDVIEMGYAIYNDNICDFPFENPIGCSGNKTYSLAPWKLEKGKTYYLSVYTRYLNAFSQCEFDLCISTPIANDDVKGAVLVQNTGNVAGEGTGFKAACSNPVTASSVGATYSFDAGVPVGACNIGTLPKDIWFKTVVGAKRNLAIQVLQSPAGASVQMVAYKLKNGVLTLLPSRCPADTLMNLTQGDTIALRVWDANGTAFGDYTLCIEGFSKTTDTKNTVCAPVTIRPIPTSDYLSFTVAHITEPTFNIIVTNMSGAQVVQKTVNTASIYSDFYTIDVRTLPAGTYVLTVSDGKNLFSKKFLKI